MTTTVYRTKWGADTIEIRADFSEASSIVEGTDDRQVAEFRHRPRLAMRRAVELAARDEGLDVESDEVCELIDLAVAKMVEV